jgi:hypothetical protein
MAPITVLADADPFLFGDLVLTHNVVLTSYRQLADGLTAIQAQCCGDPGSFSWLTMASEVAIDPIQRQAAINFHINRVATLHDAILTALQVLPTLIGTSTVVTIPAPVASAPAPDPAPAQPSTPAPDPSGQTAGS